MNKEHSLQKASKARSQSINSIKYTDEPADRIKKDMDVELDLITVDWENLIPPPPANDSDSTKIDLQILERKTKNLTEEERSLVLLVDEDAFQLFSDYCKKNNLYYPEDLIRKVHKQTNAVILKLKYKFGRARPYQLAPEIGYVISTLQTDTHHTPSYPSGHQHNGAITAEILSDIYPEHKTQWYKFAGMCGEARVLQGVHYPSDNEASMIVCRLLWENIKENLKE